MSILSQFMRRYRRKQIPTRSLFSQPIPISQSIARPSIRIPSMPMRSPSSQSWLQRAFKRNIGLGEVPEVSQGISVTEASKIGSKIGLSTLVGLAAGGYLIYVTLVKR